MCIFVFFVFFCRVDSSTSDFIYNQPKFIVFYEMLLKVFLLFCFNCKADKPEVSMKRNGTMVTVKQHCTKCIKGYVWTSQRYMPHGKYPIGNVLLSFAVLMAGASISKILLVFRHMGLCLLCTHFLCTSAHFPLSNCDPSLGVIPSRPHQYFEEYEGCGVVW